MFLSRVTILLSVIHWIVFASYVHGSQPKNAAKCTHGGILSGVFLNAGVRPRNDTIFSGVSSMDACIEKCCKVSKCDLAMKIDKVCHAIRCQDDDSCQISHRRKGAEIRADIAFITKGEEIKSASDTIPTKASTSPFSSTKTNQQSTINKKPTLPIVLTPNQVNAKAATTLPLSVQPTAGNQRFSDAVDSVFESTSGSGSSDEEDEGEEDGSKKEVKKVTSDDDDDDNEDDSGSSFDVSGESSGVGSASSTKATESAEIAPSTGREDYVLPNAVQGDERLPSASRSAIPMASKERDLDLGSPLQTYSMEESNDDDDDNTAQFDHDDDDDDDDDDSDTQKKSSKVAPMKTSLGQIHGKRFYTATKSSFDKTIHNNVKKGTKNTKVERKEGKMASESKSLDDHKKPSKPNRVSSFRKTGNSRKSKARASGSHSQAILKFLEGGVDDYQNSDVDVEDTRAVVTKTELNEQKKGTTGPNLSSKTQRDFNDVTRAIITNIKGNENDREDASRRKRLKKTGIKARLQQQAKAVHPETKLQRELSTLFAKKNSKLERNSFYKPSMRNSFEKVKKIQEQRDRKRHHPSLSLLYGKNFGESRIRYLIHRFSEWHGWNKDGILNIPETNAKCRRGVTIRGATLRGGILAGDFKTVGIVNNQHSCVDSCCKNKRCDVALMLGKECFNVKCYNSNLCGLAPATAIFDEVTPIITYVRGHVQKRSAGEDYEDQDVEKERTGNNQLLRWLKIFV